MLFKLLKSFIHKDNFQSHGFGVDLQFFVLSCIMRSYTKGRLDRYCIGIPWEGSLTCDPCYHRGPIF